MDEYITIEEAAQILRVSYRHATRFADRVRTQRAGKRIMFHKADVEKIALETGASNKGALPKPAELVPIGTMLETFERQQQRIEQLAHEVGRLQGILETSHAQLANAQAAHERLNFLEQERDRLLAENEKLRSHLAK